MPSWQPVGLELGTPVLQYWLKKKICVYALDPAHANSKGVKDNRFSFYIFVSFQKNFLNISCNFIMYTLWVTPVSFVHFQESCSSVEILRSFFAHAPRWADDTWFHSLKITKDRKYKTSCLRWFLISHLYLVTLHNQTRSL